MVVRGAPIHPQDAPGRLSRVLSSLAGDRSGVAAVEFALLLPVFALICVGAIDFGLAFDAKLKLSNAVGEGAQFAFLTGTTVQSAQVQTVVQGATTLSPLVVNVNYNSAACYCPAGSPAALSAQTCGTSCPNGYPAGKYATITATYAYQPIFPSYALLANPTLSESAVARVQ